MVARLRKSIEHTEQVKLVQRVRAFYPDVIIAAIPNGAIERPQSALGCIRRGYWLECRICAFWRLVEGSTGCLLR